MKKVILGILPLFLFAGLSCNNDLEETDLSPVKIELNMTEKKIVEDQNDFAFKLFASLYEPLLISRRICLFRRLCTLCTGHAFQWSCR